MLTELALEVPGSKGDIETPKGVPSGGLETSGTDALQTGIGVAFVLAIVAALFFIIWGGMQWITSSGDQQKLAAARARIMYAIVGLVIVLLSMFIVNLFTNFLGLDGAQLNSGKEDGGGGNKKDNNGGNNNGKGKNGGNNGRGNGRKGNNGGKKSSTGGIFVLRYTNLPYSLLSSSDSVFR